MTTTSREHDAAAPAQPAQPAVAVGSELPSRADGVVLLGEMPGSGYRKPPALARRADGQVVQLSPLLQAVLANVDGRRSYDDIADSVGAAVGRLVRAEDVAALAARLRDQALLTNADGSQPDVRKRDPLLGLRLRYAVTDPARTQRLTKPFALLFAPVLVAVVTAAFVAVTWWVLFEKGLASAVHEVFDKPGLLLLALAITVVSAGLHEFGHAAACRYGGAVPGRMGFALYLVWPAFYTDVTDSYRLGRAGRLRVDLGGLYFNAIVALAMFGIWAATGWDGWLVVIAAQVLQMVRQLAPVIRCDGYHILADLTGVPDLFARIKPTLLSVLPWRWGRPENRVLKRWAAAVVVAWVAVVVPVLLLSLVLMVWTLPRVAGTAWASAGRQWDGFEQALGDGDLALSALRGLGALTVLLPVAATAYLLVRLARGTTVRTWRRTRGKPRQRALAVLTGAAVLVSLAAAWWPAADRYVPISPTERGTLLDAAPVAATLGTHRDLRRPILESGDRGAIPAAWAANAPRPTKQRPALALVLVPRGAISSTSPAWVFPFNRPEAPGAGDNQALAVNTTDGSTVYDVAFALVWVEDGSATNANEAYALASCADCTTVAVGYQVVLVVGSAKVVVPENAAVAVNYACVECLTYALANQLVVTLPDGLSADATARLNELWEQIAAFAADLRNVPLAALRSQLQSFNEQFLAIVRADSPSAAGTGTTTGGTSPGGLPSVSPTSAPDASGGPTAQSTPDGSVAPSPDPSSTTAPTETGIPTPTTTGSSETTPDATSSAAAAETPAG